MRGEQRLDFPLQRAIVAARLFEKRVALLRRALDHRLEQRLDSIPARVLRHCGTSLWRLCHAAIQPGASRLPFARHRGPRDGEDLRDFLFGHAGEVAELDDLSLTRIEEGQLLQRLFEEQNLAVERRGGPMRSSNATRNAEPGRLAD